MERPGQSRPGRNGPPPAVVLRQGEPTDAAAALLEAGSVLVFPDLDFDLAKAEMRIFALSTQEGATKNISFDPASRRLKGAALEGGDAALLSRLMLRYLEWSQALVERALPAYAGRLQRGKTSFRPRSAGEPKSLRKDDRRLHVDSFPSQPVQGRRILRVFRNINPGDELRVWNVGEPFADYAGRFIGRTRPMAFGAGLVLQALKMTKGRRSSYDQLMLQLHDAAKLDDGYQAAAPKHRLTFAPGDTWIVFTDSTPHAALEGRFALEQTFFLPAEAMVDPAAAPLSVLQAMTGRTLA